jgi:hypothetical protein
MALGRMANVVAAFVACGASVAAAQVVVTDKITFKPHTNNYGGVQEEFVVIRNDNDFPVTVHDLQFHHPAFASPLSDSLFVPSKSEEVLPITMKESDRTFDVGTGKLSFKVTNYEKRVSERREVALSYSGPRSMVSGRQGHTLVVRDTGREIETRIVLERELVGNGEDLRAWLQSASSAGFSVDLDVVDQPDPTHQFVELRARFLPIHDGVVRMGGSFPVWLTIYPKGDFNKGERFRLIDAREKVAFAIPEKVIVPVDQRRAFVAIEMPPGRWRFSGPAVFSNGLGVTAHFQTFGSVDGGSDYRIQLNVVTDRVERRSGNVVVTMVNDETKESRAVEVPIVLLGP